MAILQLSLGKQVLFVTSFPQRGYTERCCSAAQGALDGQAAASSGGGQRAPGGNQKSSEPSTSLWLSLGFMLPSVTRYLTYHGDIPDPEAYRGQNCCCLVARSLLDCEPPEVSNCVSFTSESSEPGMVPGTHTSLVDVCWLNA